jgi:hypothetical protein
VVTRALYALIVLALVLSAGHHIDHILRGATGWPITGEVSPFTYSLAVYPLVATGLLLSRRGRVGPRAWLVVSSAGVLFLAAVHLGPAADDTVERIASGYASRAAGAAAIAELALLVTVLAGLSVYERALARRRNAGEPPRRRGPEGDPPRPRGRTPSTSTTPLP